jgi:molybdate transport system regulatory protein
MKVSARNVLSGKVSAVKQGAVNSEVELTLAGGERIVSIITNESVEKLGLADGKEAFALVKAPLVIIARDTGGMKFSTRNILEGTVKDVVHGAVNCEVSIALTGGAVVEAVVTEKSLSEMGLKAGDKASALFKASSVILAVKG